MPFRLWPKRSKKSKLAGRVRRLENQSKLWVTGPQVWAHWRSMAAGHGLLARVGDLEKWREDTEVALEELMKDVAIMERKLNKLLPVDDDEEDKESEGSATACSQSTEAFSDNNVGPHAATLNVSPVELPTTFTRRKSDSPDRTALDASKLRLL